MTTQPERSTTVRTEIIDGPHQIESVWTDVSIRAQALQSAAMVHAEQRTPSHIVIADARFFERYLRGDQ